MNLWSDSGRKWAQEAESKPEIEEKHRIIKICLIKWNIPLTPIGPDPLFAWVQIVQFE